MEPFLGRYEVVTTSGSTGQPGIFLFNPQEWVSIVGVLRSRAGMGRGKARFDPPLAHGGGLLDQRTQPLRPGLGKVADTPFLPTLRLDAVQPLPKIVESLNAWQPEV